MEKRLLICESCCDEPKSLTEQLERAGIKVILIPRDGNQILTAIEEYQPELVLCDLFLPGYDAVGILKELTRKNISVNMIVSSPHPNPQLEARVMRAGAVSYLIRPYTMNSLLSLLLEFMGCEEADEPESSSLYGGRIMQIYKEIGMRPDSSGAIYLMEAIQYVLENPGLKLRGNIYPYLAKKHNISEKRIERSMRHAIERACDCGDYDVILSYFGAIIQARKGKPTNFEFIATMTNYIRFFGDYGKKLHEA